MAMFQIGDKVKAAADLTYGDPAGPKVIAKGTPGVVTNEWDLAGATYYSVRFQGDFRDRLVDEESLTR